jgi:hypothetical protein
VAGTLHAWRFGITPLPEGRCFFMETTELVRNFFGNSKSFSGIVLNGGIDINMDVLCAAIKDYEKTGINKLDEYSDMVLIGWHCFGNYPTNQYYDDSELERFDKLLNGKGFWNPLYIYEKAEINQLLKFISNHKKKNEFLKSYPVIRKKSLHINKKYLSNLPDEEKYCKLCGTKNNLSTDHIKPLIK